MQQNDLQSQGLTKLVGQQHIIKQGKEEDNAKPKASNNYYDKC